MQPCVYSLLCSVRARLVLLGCTLSMMLCAPPANCDDDLRSLELYNGEGTEVVSGTRSPRPASQTAENITVVTAQDIDTINAHTLADVLSYVTGVQLEMTRTPGTPVNFEVQGSNYNHVLVLLDGVPINNLADNFPDVSSIPVQLIERVEVVKGAASSSWGNALGGVINVITKSPDPERPVGGVVSASYGQRETLDARAELTGTNNRFGYYLTGGKLRSDGLLPNNMADKNNFYGKLQYALPARGSLSLTTAVMDGESGMFGAGVNRANTDSTLIVSTLASQYQLMDHLLVEGALVTTESSAKLLRQGLVAPGTVGTMAFETEESRLGGNLQLSWLDDLQRITAGIDYEHVSAHMVNGIALADLLNRRADRVGLYLSDTLTLGRFALTPSARFDSTGSAGDHFSPSFGVTYALTENSVLRGYTSRGYSLTSLNRSASTEKVWTSQLGFETGDIPGLWLKGTLFRNDTWDIISGSTRAITYERHVKQGAEIEAKTIPIFRTSLTTGYTYIRGTHGDSGPHLDGVPKHTVQVGLRYQDYSAFQAHLNGRFIDWDNPGTGKYGAIIWDLHLRKTVELSETSLEIFASVRNLFNGDQYLDAVYRNPGRWVELGVRCNF
ncbi:TonB-dependent receptor [Citrifermentans bremense]|uniref:TonB-dependent receptor n=1 Tax=Citrifermentans bremense TaxID=60035 RepID=A0A6S6LZF5_9BACT|nr:TonB-dependent receptor [Citrifermentans bremense]BCG47487.1 TonB-dependent receptor [Citrifermentans bremense]